jgi:hypothetical protein
LLHGWLTDHAIPEKRTLFSLDIYKENPLFFPGGCDKIVALKRP